MISNYAPPFFVAVTAMFLSTGLHAEALENEVDVPILTEAVKEQAEPQALVKGILGGEAGSYYKDNIYRSNENAESDIISYLAPEFKIITDDEQYKATVRGRVEAGAYLTNEDNNYLDADLRANGSYLLSPDTTLLAEGLIQRNHIEVGAFVDDPNQRAEEPTIYYYEEALLGGKTFVDDARRIQLSADSQLRNYNYQNTNRLGGGSIIQDDRDRTEWYQRVRAGYILEAGLMPYIEGTYNTRSYDKRVDQTILYSRDSDGYGSMVGVEFTSPDQTLVADIAGGYLSQDYDSDVLPTINTFGAHGTAKWQYSPELAFHAGFDRSIEEAVLIGTSGYTRSRVLAGADYMLTPLWTIGTSARYSYYDFEVNPSFPGTQARQDDLYDAAAYAQYAINEVYRLGLEYRYSKRDSNTELFDFSANTILVRVGANF